VRFVPRLRNLVLLAAIAFVPVALASAVPAGATSQPTAPRIVAVPSTNLRPGQVISLRGTGFRPATIYTIEECSRTLWIVPMDPCDTNNMARVRTNRAGAFRTPFVTKVCPPSPARASAAPVVRCFVGAPQPSGVDTVHLVGAAQITVVAVR
jgi:hypothetical protein